MALIKMTERTLNALKGWPHEAALDFTSSLDSSVTVTVNAGSVVHLNSSGYFILGVGSKTVMPMFTFNNSDDPDVVNNGGDPSVDKGAFVAVSPTGQMMALPAKGAYELVSTSYTGSSFPINTHLTSVLTGATAGKLKAGTLWTDTIVGVVSRGLTDNGYGENAVAFWPVYLPPDAAHSAGF